MRGEKWLSALAGALLGFCIALGGCGCMVSGFEMGIPMKTVALCCGLCALALSVCFAFRLWIPALCALALAGGYLWRSQRAERGVEALLNCLSRFYDTAYGCGVIRWSSRTLTAQDLTVGICLVGGLVTLILCLVVCCRRRAYLGVLAGLAPLMTCLVVTDTVPRGEYLFLLLLGILLLLLTQSTRRKSAIQGIRLLGLLALPAALALAALFWAVPREGYAGQDNAEKAANAVVNWAQGLAVPEAEQPWQAFGLELDTSGLQADRVDLSQIGPQTMGRAQVMTVTAAQTGPLYLRGCSFDTYDGRTWTNTPDSGGEGLLWPGENLEKVGEVSITTRSVHPVMYFPYYPGEMDWQQFTDGRLGNPERLTSYTFSQLRMPEGYQGWSWNEAAAAPFLTLPAETRAGAEAILAGIFPDGIPDRTYFTREAASEIAAYVRGSAAYDLGTERMPAGEQDFALWFLEDSDTGYCVHFATAAVVLLRAAGIPARYVTGYLADGVAGKSVTVRQENAHAWVEFYIYGAGWSMLEPTPAEQPQEPQQTLPTQSTEGQPTRPVEAVKPTQRPSAGVTTPQTEPEAPAEDGKPLDLSWLWKGLKLAAWIGGILAAVIGQWRLRLFLRLRALRQGGPNEQALARWREAVRLSRLLEEVPDQALLELAQKAKFSQYTLTREELSRFDTYLEAARTRLRQKPLPRRLIDRLLYAAY